MFNKTEETNPNNWDNLEFEEIEEETPNTTRWTPNINDYIIGQYVSTKHGTGRGEELIFHTLEDQEGKEISILGCTVLNKKLDRVEYGQIIKIIYKGYATSQRGKEYKNYDVLVSKGE